MTNQRPTPTLYDVATKAQVSIATVSRCLNFPDQVAKATQEKVMNAVEELGYSPNFGAKAMAARRTNTIGAIIPTMDNAIFARGLQAFQEELRRHGFTMLVASSSYRADVEEEQIRSLVTRGADALLLIGHERSPEINRFLQAQGIPSLVTWAFDPATTRPSVGFDNKAAMKSLATKVIELGHRRIAFISANVSDNDRALARLHGIQQAMQKAGLDHTQLQRIETPYSIENGAAAFEKIMKSDQRPTVVLCGNDVLAVGALRRARQLGISVPHDVSITGFDDIELSRVVHPALTTVHVPHSEMGRRSAQVLVRMVKEGAEAEPIELDATLIMRETLAKASDV